MIAPVRRSTPCPHHPDVRDCGDCVAAAHRRAIAAAEVRVHAAPDQCAEVIASMAMGDAEAALDGFRILRENGVPLWQPANLGCSHRRCRACRTMQPADAPCAFASCPGRRVRYQLPEVRR